MESEEKYDVAIVGAGPAGCAAALGLGSSGLKVALIDKDEFPRKKVCGDAIPGPAIKTLKHALPFFNQEFLGLKEKYRIKSSSIILSNGRTINYSWQLPAYNIKREVFDNFLLSMVKKHTSTEIITGWEAKRVEDGKKIIIRSGDQSISAKVLIISSGFKVPEFSSPNSRNPVSGTRHPTQHSTQLSSRAQPRGKTQNFVMAVRAYYSGLGFSENTNYFYINKKLLPGYFWAFPLGEDIWNIGFGIKANNEGKVDVKIRDVLEEFVSESFTSAEMISEINGSLIPTGGEKRAYSGEGYLLAGDAASLADPLQGHGIDKAVVSGLLAAKQAISCFEKDDFSASFMSSYDKLIIDGIHRELRKNLRRQKMLSKFPSLLGWYSYIHS